jgi:1-deoxy-D-xylulose-5-phosphate synthase
MRVLAPSSAQELAQMLHDAMSLADTGPVAIRYPRGAARQVGEHEIGTGLRARCASAPRASSGATRCVVAVGKMLETAEKAAERLAEAGVAVTVWDARCCAPLDPAMIADAAAHDHVVTIEDGIRDGGIGMAVADAITAVDASTRVDVLGLPLEFLPHDPKPNAILARCGLDVDSLVAVLQRAD